MDMCEQVKLFISHGEVLTDLLKRNESELSDLDLHALRSYVHLLEQRIRDIQTFRRRAA
jgi:hypothetical protein